MRYDDRGGVVMARMTARERVLAVLQGEPVDRPPLTFWQHAPGRDLAAATFVPAVLEFQQRWDLDIIKITPAGGYQAIDYGVRLELANNDLGTTRVVAHPVHQAADWARLPRVSVEWGAVGEQVETVRQVRAASGDTPILQTLFSPLTVAARLAGGELTAVMMESPEFAAALEQLADDVVRAGLAMVTAGADGLFYATQHAHPATMPRPFFDRFGDPWDQHVLTRLREGGARILVAHVHGNDPYVDAAARWPVDCLSWHDRRTGPPLEEAAQWRVPFAGLDPEGPALHGGPEDVVAEARDAVTRAGRRIILAPGCTFPLSVPLANLQALRQAAETL
ncbi:MAG: hypothetical protein K6U89_12370 [Chloroflexi bacterium]|nr:hypothetical protein [Chloroflexota bacterium]